MQSISTLLHDDPYLRLPREARISARRALRLKMWGFAPAAVAVAHPIEPKPEPPLVYRMWFDDLIEEAERQLAKPAPRPVRTPRVAEIQSVCAMHYGVSRDDIISPCRFARVVRPRQVAMYLARKLTPLPLTEIGRRFGNRDHTTGLHAIQKMERLILVDEQLAAIIQNIKADIARRLA